MAPTVFYSDFSKKDAVRLLYARRGKRDMEEKKAEKVAFTSRMR